jgi:hypothetical protein
MDAPQEKGRVTAEERYNALVVEREPFLRRARDCSSLTIPSLLPEEGANGHTNFPQPYQSIGARGVNSLGAKFLLSLFPPSTSFVRFAVDSDVEDQLNAAGAQDAKGEIDKALRRTEEKVLARVERGGFRRTASELFRHLIVAGNVLLDLLPNNGSRLHPLTSYVVKRDGEGNGIEIVFFEALDRRTLPPSVIAILAEKVVEQKRDQKEKVIKLFTRALLEDKKWKIWQEVEGTIVPGSESTYPQDSSPLIPLRWTKVDGQDYGRSHVDDYIGDLRSAESLRKSIIELTAAIAKVLIFVDENGVTSISDIETAENLAVLPGRAADITTFVVEKTQELRVAKEELNDIKRDLAAAFLLASSVQRDAERVTAEEIRVIANELDQTVGGSYAVLSQELQHPLVAFHLRELTKDGKVSLPKKYVITRIVTGLEALGRNSDLDKLRMFGSVLNEMFGPQFAATVLNPRTVGSRVATALGLEEKGLVLTEEQMQANQATEIATDFATKAAPGMMKQGAVPTA